MLNIVSIDDLETNNIVIAYDLEEYFDQKEGFEYSFKEFTDPREGLKYVVNNQIDLLFLDVMMPVLDGFDVLKQIRSNAYAHQPFVIIVTALNDESTKQKAKLIGADEFISKPYDIDEIHKMIDRFLEAHHDEFYENGGHLSEDDFFDFDQIFIDEDAPSFERFDKKHDQISAKDFHKDLMEALEDGYEGIIADFKELFDDIDELQEVDVKNIKKHIPFFIHILSKFSLLLETIGEEFGEIGYSLSISKYLLNDIEKIEDRDRLELISALLNAFIADIKSWIKNVIFKRDAIDIYYANESFNYSIYQIQELMKG